MEKVTETAIRAAREAGSLMRERLGKIRDIDYKGAFNIVTDVDKGAERIILDILNSEFPDYSVLAEEGGATGTGAERRWLIDPLDGTTNYAHSYPFFCVSIGLEDAGKMVSGVVYNPIADELFWAETGKGAWLNQHQLKVSKVSALSESLLATGFPYDTAKAFDNNMARFMTLTNLSHGVRRDGAAALDFCFVAAGRLDGFWEAKLSPWDMAAGSIIVKEAGGEISDFGGAPFDVTTAHVLATNGLIHEQVLTVLKELSDSKPKLPEHIQS
jgi:myo-inositol-1(or 4)-monophosphatase